MKYSASIALVTIVSGAAARTARAVQKPSDMRKPMIFEHQRLQQAGALKLKVKKRQNAGNSTTAASTEVSVIDQSGSAAMNVAAPFSNATLINMYNSTMNLYTDGEETPAPSSVPQSNAALWSAACSAVLSATSAQYPNGYLVDPTFGPMFGVVENGNQLGCMVTDPTTTNEYLELVYNCQAGATCAATSYTWGTTEYNTVCCTAPVPTSSSSSGGCGCGSSPTGSALPSASASSGPELGCPVDEEEEEETPCQSQTPTPICSPAATCGAATATTSEAAKPTPTCGDDKDAEESEEAKCTDMPAPPPKVDAGSMLSVGLGLPVAVAFGSILTALL